MNPEQFHTAKTYGDCKIFRKRFIEGYREVAFGMGEWVDNKKMVAIWIFYSPEHQPIRTIEHPKYYYSINDGHTFERRYFTEWGLKIHLARFHIKLYPKESLKKVIRQSDINDRVLEKQLIIKYYN